MTDKITAIEATISSLRLQNPRARYADIFEAIGILGRESQPVDRKTIAQRIRLKTNSMEKPLGKINEKLKAVNSPFRVAMKPRGHKHAYWIVKNPQKEDA